jgi:hypothetical protein
MRVNTSKIMEMK